jgi:hemophore-related protein
MQFNRSNVRPGVIGVAAGAVLAGAVAATIAAPTASAAPDCSPGAVSGTVNTATANARGYLMSHPGADQAVAAAYAQPQSAASTLRSYFTANPGEYHELRGILAPIGDTQRQCNVNVLPAGLSMAYDQFMAG